MHLSVVNDPLTEALAILVLNFETAVGTSPLLNRGIGHSGGNLLHWPLRTFAYISFSRQMLYFPSGLFVVQVDVTILAS